MEYTTNYHLPQWVETDRIMMGDFNEAMSSIEEGMSSNAVAAAEKPYVVGSYIGDGSTTDRKITLGFRPRFVIISGATRSTSSSSEALGRFAFMSQDTTGAMGSLNSNGFSVSNNSFPYPQLNASNCTYGYIAFR